MNYTTMTIFKLILAFLSIFMTLCLKDILAQRMSLEDLQLIYKNSAQGHQVCVYDGSICLRGQEYCSVVEHTCVPIFKDHASEEERLGTCKEILKKNESKTGIQDTCIYLLGDMERRRVIGNPEGYRPLGSLPLPVTQKELCPFPDKYCQRGQEFCNVTSKDCEPLFPTGFSDTEKRQRCDTVIQENVTMLWDACIYAMGILSYSKTNVTYQTAGEDTNASAIITGSVLAGIFVLVTAALVIFFIIRRWKLRRFQQIEQPKPTANEHQDDNDVPMPGNKLLAKVVALD